MSEFKSRWEWRVIVVDGGGLLLEVSLNEGWTITKTTPTASSVVYVLKREKPNPVEETK